MSAFFPRAGDRRELPIELRDLRKEECSPPSSMSDLRMIKTFSFPRNRGDAVGNCCKDHVSLWLPG